MVVEATLAFVSAQQRRADIDDEYVLIIGLDSPLH